MGWWGPITSNVDWCERNYVVTHYIAEFYNSTSSIPMILMGIFGMIWSFQLQTQFQLRFISSFFFLALVGVGSTMFHMTLLYEYQLLDELPMILGTLVFFYCILDLQNSPKGIDLPRKIRTPTSPSILFTRSSGLTAYGLATIYVMSVYTHSPLPMNLSYAFMVFVFILRAISLVWNDSDPIARRWFLISLSSYLGGAAVWMIEKNFCDPLRPVSEYLHMIWHILAGYGTYAIITWMAYLTAKEHELGPKMKMFLGMPFVSLPVKRT